MNPQPPDGQSCGSELARDSERPARGYASLRSGRWTTEGATYFVTFCTTGRRSSLAVVDILDAIAHERLKMEADQAWRTRCAVVMPDHVHLVFELGARLPLARCIARLKARTSRALSKHRLSWQAGFFEHRLRPSEDILPLLRYVFLNPVRAGLTTSGKDWPGFFCRAEDWSWFAAYAQETVLEPEWLSKAETVASKLAPTVSSRENP